MTRKPRIGRPPLPKKQTKGRLLSVRFRFEDWPTINGAARRANQSLSDWARSVLLAAAIEPDTARLDPGDG